MAYENVRFKEGEEKTVIVDGYEEVVSKATIDYETGNFMFMYYVNRDSPKHKRFEIVIRGIVVDVWFYRHYDKKHQVTIWTLEKYIRNGNINKKELYKEMSKAVEAYGSLGNTLEEKQYYLEKYGDDKNGVGKLDLGGIK